MTRPDSLLQRQYLPFVVGAVALVTLGALADRATSTVLPTTARQLDGLAWFGIAVAAPGLSYLLGASLAGVWADRRGPRQPLIIGIVCFIVGNLVVATSPTMIMVVLGRFCSGFAEALFDISLTVMVAAALPEVLRPRIYALYSTAWLLPSVLGPQLAGWGSELIGWRSIFLGCAVIAVPVGAVLLAVSRSAAPGRADQQSAAPLRYAVIGSVLMAAMSALTPLGERGGRTAAVALVAAVLLAVGTVTLVSKLGPRGVLRLRPGLPSVFTLTAVLNVAFGTVSSYLPFYVQQTRGLRPALAGVVLTITGIFWAVGSWTQGNSRIQRRTSAQQRVAVAFVLIAIGCLSLLTLPIDTVPLVLPYAGWAVAGIGVGMASPTLAVTRINMTPETEQGRGAAAASLLTSTSGSSATIVLGLLLASTAIGSIAAGGQLVLVSIAALCGAAAIAARRIGATDAATRPADATADAA